MGVAGEYGADGLGFEDEESSMSVSRFKYDVYSGNVWSKWVEPDNELFVFDEGCCGAIRIGEIKTNK